VGEPVIGRYGLDAYGKSPWGGITLISIAELYPLGPRALYARFNVEPLTASPVSVGDCQNRRTWNLTRDDTGERIEVVGVLTLGSPTERKLILLSSLGPSAVMHTLDCSALRTSGGLPATPPSMIQFPGVDVDKPAFGPAANKPGIVDLKNDHFFGKGEALQTQRGGSYAVQAGAPGLRKRLLRMLTTPLGTDPSDPEFGCQLAFKELVTDPVGQKALILAQVLRDPEVGEATVGLDVSDGGVANITIAAKMRSGGSPISTSVVVDDSGVRLG
jgi:hypothetical protein